jgi:hypothetical protein
MEKRMNKAKLLKFVNPILALFFLVQVLTVAVFLFFNSILDFDIFAAIHKWAGLAFVCLAAAHIYLNWSWIKANVFPKRKEKV